MIVDDVELGLWRACKNKKMLEEQIFKNNEHDREIFEMLAVHEEPAFVQKRLDKGAFSRWSCGFAARGLRPQYR